MGASRSRVWLAIPVAVMWGSASLVGGDPTTVSFGAVTAAATTRSPAAAEALRAEDVSVPTAPEPRRAGEQPIRAAAAGNTRASAQASPDASTVEGGAGVTARIDETGGHLFRGGESMRLGVTAIGRRSLRGTHEGRVSRAGARLERELTPGIREWFAPVGRGIEHGLDIASRPDGRGDLVVGLAIDAGGTIDVSHDRIRVHGPNGAVVASYVDLVTLDADGRSLPSHFESTTEGGATIRVDDRGARYPIVVDPLAFFEVQKIRDAEEADGVLFGYALAMSGDGTHLVVGAPHAQETTVPSGAVYVYAFVSGAWSLEQTLSVGTLVSGAHFGHSVAITTDATRIAIGTPYESTTGHSFNGSVYVYSRAGTVWSLEQKVLPTTVLDSEGVGSSVALTGDGLRLLVGAPDASVTTAPATLGSGVAYLFNRAGTVWTQGSRTFPADRAASDHYGRSVAIGQQTAGYVAVVGAPDADETAGVATTDSGAVYAYLLTGSVLNQEAKIVESVSERANGDRLGTSVAMSTNGQHAVIGAPFADDLVAGTVDTGGAWIWNRIATNTWQQEARLRAGDPSANARFGTSVAVNGTGTFALAGAISADGRSSTSGAGQFAGAAYVYARTGTTTWNTAAEKLFASDGTYFGLNFGTGVALSDDSIHAAVGAANDENRAASGNIRTNGSVYAFTRLATLGTTCMFDSECGSGHCVENVCCNSACGGGNTTDCQSCRASLTGLPEGTCGAFSAAAPLVTCRPAAGECDAPERCQVGNTSCPSDVKLDSTYSCGTVAGNCDVREFCDGVNDACPPDAVLPQGIQCRGATLDCDVAETCDGVSGACPPDGVETIGTVCRPSGGSCDPAETCNGSSPSCPSDVRLPAGTVCGSMVGPCDVAESCDGTSAACPPDAFVAAGATCRNARGICDVAESCTGASAQCPVDDLVADGTICDDGLTCSIASACVAGLCTASTSQDCSDSDPCTTDVCSEPSGCSHVLVVGCVDVGMPTDAGDGSMDLGDGTVELPDAGVPSPKPAGCSCHVAGARSGAASAGFAFVAIALATLGRNRSRHGRSRRTVVEPRRAPGTFGVE